MDGSAHNEEMLLRLRSSCNRQWWISSITRCVGSGFGKSTCCFWDLVASMAWARERKRWDEEDFRAHEVLAGLHWLCLSWFCAIWVLHWVFRVFLLLVLMRTFLDSNLSSYRFNPVTLPCDCERSSMVASSRRTSKIF